jgi:Phage integrase, N-terminal SAM-like domain
MQMQRRHITAGEVMGLPTIEPPPVPKPQKTVPTEPPSVQSHVHPLAAPARPDGKRLPLVATVDKFVHDMTVTRGYQCGEHYQVMLRSFIKVTTKTYPDEIDDDEVIRYVGALKKRALSPRTIKNYCAALNAFLRRYNYKDCVKKRFIPKVTKKIARAYTSNNLKGLFAAGTQEERMLHLPALSLWQSLQEKTAAILDHGVEDTDQGKAAHIEIKQDLPSFVIPPYDLHWYFDPNTGLPLKVRYFLPTDSGVGFLVEVTYEFSEYQTTDGISIPRQIVISTESLIPFRTSAFQTTVAPCNGHSRHPFPAWLPIMVGISLMNNLLRNSDTS